MTDIVITLGDTYNQAWSWGMSTFNYSAITAITQGAPATITSTAHGVPNNWQVAIVGVQGMTQINAAGTPPRKSDFHIATKLDVNTIALNDVISSGFSPYVSGGYIMYNTPISLSGFTAQLQINSPQTPTQVNIVCMIPGTSGPAAPQPSPLPYTTLFADGSVSWAISTATGIFPAWQANHAYTANTVATLSIGETIYAQLNTTNGGIVLDTTNFAINVTIPAATTALYSWTTGNYELVMTSGTGVVTTIDSGNVTVATPAFN